MIIAIGSLSPTLSHYLSSLPLTLTLSLSLSHSTGSWSAFPSMRTVDANPLSAAAGFVTPTKLS